MENQKGLLFIQIFPAVMLFLLLFVIAVTIPETESQQSWQRNETAVWIDNSNVFILATPHTLRDSGYMYFKVKSKLYSGNINVIFGFNISNSKPKSIELWNPRVVTETKSFICDPDRWWFNYTLNPNHMWCWRTEKIYTNLNVSNEYTNFTHPVFDHSFDSYNLPSRTIFWNESHNENWTSIAGLFNKINHNYDGKNVWYYATNVPVQMGEEYLVRVWIDAPVTLERVDSKFDFAIYPSVYGANIPLAISNGHFFMLDPWLDTAWRTRVSIFTNMTATGTNGVVGGVTLVNQDWRVGTTAFAFVNTSYWISIGKMQADCDDIRFTNGSGDTLLGYYFPYKNDATYGCNTNQTIIFVNSSIATTNSTLYMYMDNPSASDISSARSVFPTNKFGSIFHTTTASTYVSGIPGAAQGTYANGASYQNDTGETVFGYYVNMTNNVGECVDLGSYVYPAGSDFALSFWIKRGTNSAEQRIFEDGADSLIRFLGGSINCGFRDGTGNLQEAPTGSVSSNVWHNVLCMVNRSGGNYFGNAYLDGKFAGTTPNLGGEGGWRFPDGIRMGGKKEGGPGICGGGGSEYTTNYKLDEVYFWEVNYYPSDEEILRMYEQGLMRFGDEQKINTTRISPNEDVHTDTSSFAAEAENHIYLKFPLTELPSGVEVTKAELILNATSIIGTGANLRAYNCTGEWTESSNFSIVTSLACTNSANSTNVNALGLKFWNLTSYIKGIYDSGGRNITLRLNSTNLVLADILSDGNSLKGGYTGTQFTNNNYAQFNSREVGVFTPVLNITYSY